MKLTETTRSAEFRSVALKQGLQQEYALGMMPEGPMPEVCQVLLTGVDRLVKRQIVHWFAAVLPGLKRYSRA